ncbi:MAG: hypothetical protein IH618_07160 [Ignavibacteriaceae bacterium]|nr:hypothetical protein [Ignavibacteriaceae bacterium]
MRYIIITSLFFLLISCKEVKLQSDYSSSLPKKNIFILDASAFRDSTWIPSKDDINNIFKQIQIFLSNPPLMNSYDSIAVNKIKSKFNLYAVQLSGEYHNGRKIIWCNFFPKTDLRFINYDLKNTPHIVDDGGADYWQISYDLISKNLFNFFVNGEA